MARTANFLALDLGAESCRGLVGAFDGEQLSLEDVYRFPNGPARMGDTLYWDLPQIWEHCKLALRKAKDQIGTLDGIGVDTWGVDFTLFGRDDTLLSNPVHYRDSRTTGMIERASQRIAKQRIYEITGLQFLPFNTVYQLFAMVEAKNPLLDIADSMLMMPDTLAWLLTGRKAGERTDASTTQLLDPRSHRWSDEICAALSIPRAILPDLIEPGTKLGSLLPAIRAETGLGDTAVYATAGHDTAAAVAAVPARPSTTASAPDWCYISSGTWSLMGIENPSPIINELSYKYNFTNEGGVFGTTRLLKNIMGLWLIQECRRAWQRSGRDFSYSELIERANSAPAFTSLVDPDDPSFLSPGDMPARIAAFCERTGQPVPADEGAFVRCALESLALKYRVVLQWLEELAGSNLPNVHIVGGGTRNETLCQFTANACGRPVIAGPIEATAIGNVLLQAVGRGQVGSLREAREIVERSFPIKHYVPSDPDAWLAAAAKFQNLLARVPL
jgi:rhamnulokinase